MGSTTDSPETSPTRGGDKASRPGSDQPIPAARHSLGSEEDPSTGDYSFDDLADHQDSGVVRKGRGTFRGPTADSPQDQASRTPRGRDFDATTLRQYPPKGAEAPQNTGGRRKSASGKRQGSNGGLPGSESGESGSDSNANDEVTRLATSLETTSLGGNDKESKFAVHNHTESPLSPTQDHQPLEDWESIAEGDGNLRASVFGQMDAQQQADYRMKADAQKADGGTRPFKKGHKKSKSSKIEFNFDPDAYDGSTRILDIFDFPASFKTHHLHEIFQEYENMRGGYRIKWMDDTRALIIFEHPATARKAYLDNVTNELAQIKPYDGPTDFLQKNPTNALPRARPATTDMVAKRLVQGALGVRVQRSPEQRQAERQMLQNAREQREQKRSDADKRSQDLDAAFNE